MNAMYSLRQQLMAIYRNRIARRVLLAALLLGLGIFFLRHEKAEWHAVKAAISSAKFSLVMAGIGITVIYLSLLGMMYVKSFQSAGSKIDFFTALQLWLKRNFIGMFLPGGNVASLMFYNAELEKKGIENSKSFLASTAFTTAGFGSILIVSLPVIIYLAITHQSDTAVLFGFLLTASLVALITLLFIAVIRKNRIYKTICRWFPGAELFVNEFAGKKISVQPFITTLLYSCVVEVTGLMHLAIALLALHHPFNTEMVVIAYVSMLMALFVSPFMKGLGAVEFAMSYTLIHYGLNAAEALSVTLLFRFFEFWIPLFLGSFVAFRTFHKTLSRFIPALFIFTLGLVNILSVVTPPIKERLGFVMGIIGGQLVAFSNTLVLATGIIALFITPYLLIGMRTAWWLAVVITLISVTGNLAKALDYEEATVALIVLAALFYSRKKYFMKSRRVTFIALSKYALAIVAGVIIYGVTVFYFIDARHFQQSFSFMNAVKETFSTFLLLNIYNLEPHTLLAREFLSSLRLAGVLSLIFLLYTILRPHVAAEHTGSEQLSIAETLVKKYSRSSLDYFKTYFDKEIFLSASLDGFMAYKVSGNFALALEGPVCDDSHRKRVIEEFEEFCRYNNLLTAYYRVDETDIPLFTALHKRSMMIGEEAIVDLQNFSLSGKEMKSQRNAVNKIESGGYVSKIYEPPVPDRILQQLHSVSDEWLNEDERHEVVFSGGMFNMAELKKLPIITIESREEKILAFISLQPVYNEEECSFDLLRKTRDAPNGSMDFLVLKSFEYFRAKNIRNINLGLAPMSGIESAENLAEHAIKFAYEKIKRFSHYQGLRNFKEKFNPVWKNKYLVYDESYQLISISIALGEVMKPD